VGSGLVPVVDDDDNVRHTTAGLVEMHGFEVVQASSGGEAVEVFSARPDAFEAVLLDVTMPGMSGQQTLRALRAIRRDVPIVVMSGYDETDAQLEADGLTTFLPKPFTVEQLISSFREVLAKTG